MIMMKAPVCPGTGDVPDVPDVAVWAAPHPLSNVAAAARPPAVAMVRSSSRRVGDPSRSRLLLIVESLASLLAGLAE
jgi:hypothetical protein